MENKPNDTECRDCKHFFTPPCGCPSYCLEETVPYGEGCPLHQKREEDNLTPFGAGD